jgi:hypothetical protein
MVRYISKSKKIKTHHQETRVPFPLHFHGRERACQSSFLLAFPAKTSATSLYEAMLNTIVDVHSNREGVTFPLLIKLTLPI